MFVDYDDVNARVQFLNNEAGGGDVVETLKGMHYDPGLLRPFLDSKGRPAVTVNTGRVTVKKDADGRIVVNEVTGQPETTPVYETQLISNRIAKGLPTPNITQNATLLRKDQWIQLDNAVLSAALDRLRAWSDLRAANTYGGFDGMANPLLQWERMTHNGEAMMDMDGMTEGRASAPQFDLVQMPLPITHSDFFLSSRFLAISRNRGGQGMDTIRAQMAGRMVGELIEKTLLGYNTNPLSYGDVTGIAGSVSKVYGYMNHPNRITKTDITAPTGTNPNTVLADWLACRELFYAQNFYGPWIVYTSTDYDQYLDNDYYDMTTSGAVAPTQTLRQRLLQIEGVQAIRRLDYLPSATYPFRMIWVEMKPETARAVNGMEITTVQWESMGGMRLNFKVMGIQVPQIRARYVGNSTSSTAAGVLVATTS